MPHDWEHIRKAMAYSRSHRDGAEAEELRKLVKPLLDSNADLQNCIDLHHGGSGFNMVCEMDQPLWDRPAVVFFQMILAPCRQDTLFCFVRFVPLFQSSPAATLKTKVSPYEQRPRRPGPDPRQVLVREYVEDLQSRIRSTIVLPPDTPPTAHLEYQIQFNQESGRTYSVNFQSGCYCPRLRRAFFDAVKKLEPLPTLPPERQVILGGKNGRVYVKFDASQTRQ